MNYRAYADWIVENKLLELSEAGWNAVASELELHCVSIKKFTLFIFVITFPTVNQFQ